MLLDEWGVGAAHGQNEKEWGTEFDNAMQGREEDRRGGGVGVRVGGMKVEWEMSQSWSSSWSWLVDEEAWREGEEEDRKR